MLYINNECVNAYNETGDTPTWLHDHEGNRAFKLAWHSTDGWRGYYDVLPVKKYGWQKIDFEGWVTGNWSDAPEDARADNVERKLKKLASEYAKKDYDVEAVFTLTSNVFSTAFDVFVKLNVKKRLAYLRREIEAERISYGEIAELQSLKKYIEPGDMLLQEWAGIPESKAR